MSHVYFQRYLKVSTEVLLVLSGHQWDFTSTTKLTVSFCWYLTRRHTARKTRPASTVELWTCCLYQVARFDTSTTFFPLNGYTSQHRCSLVATTFVKGGALSEQSPQQIAEDLKTLADTIVPRIRLVHVIGIPERHNKKERTAKVNEILERFTTKADWKYRNVSKYIWSRHISEDSVHLTDDGLKNLKKFLKEKILHKLCDIEQDKKGPRKVTVCGNAKQPDCLCGHFNPPS